MTLIEPLAFDVVNLNLKFLSGSIAETVRCRIENYNYLNVAFLSYKLTMWN